MRMVRSSVPGAMDRDRAIRLLTERAVLTRMICRELKDGNVLGMTYGRRPPSLYRCAGSATIYLSRCESATSSDRLLLSRHGGRVRGSRRPGANDPRAHHHAR